MHFHLVAILFQLLITSIFSFPAEPTIDPFEDPEIPILESLDSKFFNLTALEGGDLGLSKRARKVTYVLYKITINGINQGNAVPFKWSGGELLYTSNIASPGTRNGRNGRELVIALGSPGTNPVAGSIRYISNRYLYKLFRGNWWSVSALDFAFISTNLKSNLKLTVDQNIAAANSLSTFNTHTGPVAQVYIIAAGNINISWNSRLLVGKINLVGRSFIGAGWATYKATITGTPVGKRTINL
jgi:hypothetical protein